jgi:3-oxoacyl-[acyl-carrier protein] reductase
VSRFTGEVAVITGAGGGIGAATAARLATEVAAVALRDPTAPQHVAQKIGEIPGVARAYVCDVTDEPAVQTVFARIAAEMGCPHSNENPVRAR